MLKKKVQSRVDTVGGPLIGRDGSLNPTWYRGAGFLSLSRKLAPLFCDAPA